MDTCYAFCRRFIVRPMRSPTHSPEIPPLCLLSTCITLPPGCVTCLLSLLFSCTHSTHNGAAYLCSSRKPPCSTFSVKPKELWIPKSYSSDFSPPTARLHSWLPLSRFWSQCVTPDLWLSPTISVSFFLHSRLQTRHAVEINRTGVPPTTTTTTTTTTTPSLLLYRSEPPFIIIPLFVCVCVCVCVRER